MGQGVEQENRIRALGVALALTSTSEVRLFDAPIWGDTDDAKSVYTLDWSGEGIATVERTKVVQEGMR